MDREDSSFSRETFSLKLVMSVVKISLYFLTSGTEFDMTHFHTITRYELDLDVNVNTLTI